jgi:hypothetical protein
MDGRGVCRAGVVSRETFGAGAAGFFGGVISDFARADAGFDLGLGAGFFTGFFCATRFAVDERFFAAGDAFALFGGVRRDFAAAGFLRFAVGFFLDFGLDLRAIGNVQLCRTWMAGGTRP